MVRAKTMLWFNAGVLSLTFLSMLFWENIITAPPEAKLSVAGLMMVSLFNYWWFCSKEEEEGEYR